MLRRCVIGFVCGVLAGAAARFAGFAPNVVVVVFAVPFLCSVLNILVGVTTKAALVFAVICVISAMLPADMRDRWPLTRPVFAQIDQIKKMMSSSWSSIPFPQNR